MNTRSSRLLVLSFVILLFTACSSGPTKVESDLGIKGAPDWVNKGSTVLKKKDNRLFHGVGSAPMMSDISFQTSVADNRARAEIARILSSYMDVVSKDYVATNKEDDTDFVQQKASREIKNITQLNLTGARIIGHWRDSKNHVIYSIAELDMKHVKETVKNVEKMNSGFKKHFQTEGNNIFDRSTGEKD